MYFDAANSTANNAGRLARWRCCARLLPRYNTQTILRLLMRHCPPVSIVSIVSMMMSSIPFLSIQVYVFYL